MLIKNKLNFSTMKIRIFFTLVLVSILAVSCGDWEDDLVRDNKPAIPVTYPGSTSYGAAPFYQQPRSQDLITITVAIPPSSPLKIEEVSKVIAGAVSITPGNLMSSTVASYISEPILVDGYTVTFTTSITEFNSKVAAATRYPDVITGVYEERAFMFLLKMEDGSQIIPTQIRVRVTPAG